jgi:OmpA family protein
VRDLIEICSPDQNDPMMTAAVNFCHGFAEAAVIVEEAHETQKGARRLFYLPTPRPPRGIRAEQLYRVGERAARTARYAGDRRYVHLCCRQISVSRRGAQAQKGVMKRLILAAVVSVVPLAGCADMNPTQQRALSGTAIGAGGGAIIGAIAGNAGLGAGIGAAAGLAGGLIYDQVEKGQASSYQAGYQAGSRRQLPNPLQ